MAYMLTIKLNGGILYARNHNGEKLLKIIKDAFFVGRYPEKNSISVQYSLHYEHPLIDVTAFDIVKKITDE